VYRSLEVTIHRPTGSIFAACSTPFSRTQWTPANRALNASARSRSDYVANYDPETGTIRKFAFSGFSDPRGYNAHGMDVVSSSSTVWSDRNSGEHFVYLVNQRPPLEGIDSESVAAPNSSVEIFRLSAFTGNTLEHVATVESDLIVAPNDVVGSEDGKSFWVTNDGSNARGVDVSISPTTLRVIEVYIY
jgi:arylesterase/paraoxonase